jgi:hypothetical protein
MRRYTRAFAAAAILAVASAAALLTGVAGASTSDWTAYPGQAASYTASIQQPVNTDGSSVFKANGKAVVPIKFSLSKGLGAFVFESIGSDSSADNDYSYVSYSPPSTLLFKDVTSLVADYSFSLGSCHGGSLRWSVRVSPTQSVFIYYGASPSFANCSGLDSQSGTNMISLTDLRYDTSQVGGTFYDDHAGAVALVGNMPIVRASLVLDSGWGGDQRLTLASASVNDSTFTPDPATLPAPTCDLPTNATIKVTKTSAATAGAVNEPLIVQSADNSGVLKVVDCKLMYNLATSSLSGAGEYTVEAVIDGVTTYVANFKLQ